MPTRGSNALRTWLVALLALAGAVLGVSTSLAAITANPTPVCANQVCTITFAAGNEYSFTQPSGVPLTFTLGGGAGGKGGNDAAAGGAGKAGDTFTFTANSTGTAISVYPGGAGAGGANGASGWGSGAGGASAYPSGGYDGGAGGNAGSTGSSGGGGGGGAASVVVFNGTTYVAAGGGGGAGGDVSCAGPGANAYALAKSSANTYGGIGPSAGGGDGSGAGGGGGGARGGNAGGLGSCGGEVLGGGGYSGQSVAPSGTTVTLAGNAAAGYVTISWPDQISTTLVPQATITNSRAFTYALTFAESVTGLATTDFTLGGTATGCSVSSVSGSGTTYTVTVSGCAAATVDKTVILTLPTGSVTGTSTRSNMAVTAATVTIDPNAPTMVITAPQPYAEHTYFDFTITGSEPLAGYDVSDFTLAGGTCSIESVTGAGNVLTVNVVGCSHLDTTKLTIKAGSLTDLAGNLAPATALSSANETVNIPLAPAVTTNSTLSGETSVGVQVGTTLTLTPATFTPAGRNVIAYSWYRCYSVQATASGSLATDCQQIIGATATTYTATQNDVGYYLRGVATATNASGTIVSATANSSVVLESDILSTGWDNTCVIKEGLVYCWGQNTYGAAGNGTTTDVLTPPTQPVKLANGSYLTNVVSVDTASEHTCALTSAGAMYCWGRNNWYQLGDGTSVNKSTATLVTAQATGAVGFTTGVVAISAGEAHTCALKAGGAAYCWGYNDYGQLSDGSGTQRTVPTRVLSAASTPATNLTDVEINRYNVCVLSNAGGVTGQALCAGHGGTGQMGNGTSTAYNYYLTKVQVSSTDASFVGATDISVSSHEICAVRSGAAFCWGYNPSGQMGQANTTNQLYPVTPLNTAGGVSFASGVVQVETSKSSSGTSCFLKSTGAVYCVGLGTSGQLSDGTVVTKTTAVASTFFATGTKTLSLGELFICGIDASGLSCLGENSNGQLGSGNTTTVSATEVVQPVFNLHLGAVDEVPLPGANTVTGFSGTGQVLTGSTAVESVTGSWYGYPLPALTYQWLRCDLPAAQSNSVPTDCSPIAGATALTYTVTQADLGKYLRFETIGTNFAGTALSVSANTAAIGVAPANTALPTITLKAGTAGVTPGDTATITAGTWTGTPTPTSSYKWMRCSTNSANSTLTLPTDCVFITDATGLTYTFTASDVGSYVRGVEVSSSASGVNYAYTATVGVVQESRVIAAGLNHTCVIKQGFVYCWGFNGYGQLGDNTSVSKTSMPATPIKFADGTYLKNVISVDAGQQQSCALTVSGALYCWGYNGHGELGDGTTTDRWLPTQVSGLASGVVAFSEGYYGGCAIKTGGALVCWGYNANGQIGDNTNTQRLVPTTVQGMTSGVTQVSSANQTNCAIKMGALYCWGYNGYGTIGDNSVSARWLPTAVPGMTSNVTDISEGWATTCAVKDGAAWCWGNNLNGQIGDNTLTQRNVPVQVLASAATPAVSFTSGVVDVEVSEYDPASTCLIKQNQKIYCTGANAQGQLGTGNTTQFTLPTAPALFSGNVTAAALGRYHTCVIMDGKVSCIGYNANGEIANGTTTSTSTVLATQTAFGYASGVLDVMPVSGGATYTGYVGVGETVTGATTLDAFTGTWAGYSYPTLSYQWLRCTSAGTATDAVPTDCVKIDGATSITYNPVLFDVSKYLRFEVIGTNSAGSVLAVSATAATVGVSPVNTALPNLQDIDGGFAGSIPGVVESITAGSWSGTPAPASTYQWYRCLTAKAAASLIDPAAGDCWAIDSATAKTYTLTASDVGYYIVGAEIASSTAGKDVAYTQSTTQVRDSKAVSAGDNHVCAIRLGRVYCWGLGTSGQLGDGTLVSKSVATGPVKFADGTILENVVTVESQDTATCAVTVSGSLYCWGTEGTGEFGDGTLSATRTTPVRAMLNATTPLTDVVGISTSSSATCAIRTGGSLWCWGYNAVNGQLGDGTTTNRLYPVQIIASGVQQVSADSETTCAIVSSALKCWGNNGHSVIGDGTATSRVSPVAVTGMSSGVTDISVGSLQTCAVKDGAAFCWGYNGYGQVGNGNTTTMTIPTQVVNTANGVTFTDDVVNIEANELNAGHSCATKTGGVLYCWGYNGYGQLTNGLAANSSIPVASTLWASGVSEIAGGYRFTCVIQNGADYCTGYNGNGELGNSTLVNSVASNAVSPLTNFAGALDVAPFGGNAIIAGTPAVGSTLTGASSGWQGFPMPAVTYQWYNCVTSGATVAGLPADCQAISGATSATYVPVTSDVANYLRFVATGTSAAGSTVVSSGSVLVGLAPDATFIERTSAPAGFMAVGTVITQFQDEWAGYPKPTITNVWYRCATPGVATEIIPADCYLIAGATGSTYTTTASDVGQYIRGAQVASNEVGTSTALSPTAGYVMEVQTVAVAAGFTCVVKAGEVWCAGVNSGGELGNNTLVASTTPVKVLVDATTPLSKVVTIDGSGRHTCAIVESGAMYCWGVNADGRLGNGTTVDSKVASLVSGNNTYAAVSAGSYVTCGIKVGASLQCWGQAATNYLVGDGTAVNKTVPTQVTGMTSGVSKVSAGYISVCGVKFGALFCWGSNPNYQLGNGTTAASSTPVAVTNMASGVTDVSVSTANACAVKDGSAFCWGYNADGQLGTGNATQVGTPTQVVATAGGVVFTSGVTDVEVSNNNTYRDWACFNKSGALYCTGFGTSGTLFDGGSASSTRPVVATNFASGVSEVSLGWGPNGYGAGCLVKTGALYCVGTNDTGQLMNGTTAALGSPVRTPVAPTAFASSLGDVASAPAVVVAPSVDAAPGVGNVSFGDPGAFSANPDSTETYKWYVCTGTGDVATAPPGDCVPATGAGFATTAYTPVATDAGKYLRLAVTATNSAGSVTSVSAVSAAPVGKGDQVITITAPQTIAAGSAATSITAVSDMGVAVTLTSATPTICTVSAGKVTPLSTGRCQIDAAAAATTAYNAATASVEIYISAVAQTVTFTAADRPYSAATATLSATASSALAVSFASSTPTICTVSGSTLTYVNVGTCTITATQAGNTVYGAATPVVVSFQVTKATQTLAFTPPASLSTFDTVGWSLTSTPSSGGPVSYTVADPSICNIVAGKLVAVAVGNCSVTAWQAGDTKYSPASTTVTLSVVTAPEVTSVSTTAASPTNATSIPVAVTFSAAVTGFALSDIAVVPTGACTVAALAGSGANYTFNLTNCAAGPIAVKIAAKSVTSGTAGPSADYISATLVTIDKTAPAVASATAVSPANTNSVPISYTLTFAEAVTGLTSSDLVITGTATGCVASITPVSATVYTVSLTSCTDGTLGFNLAANSVTDLAGNNGPAAIYTVAPAVKLDRVDPAVTSAVTTSPAITNASTISYTVTFPEAVTGFTADDVATIGTATGCVATVTPVSATVYTVALASCSDGTLALQVAADSVSDAAGNLGPTADYLTPGTITIDRTGPAVVSVSTTAPALTNTLPLPFVVTFADAVTGFSAADVSAVGSATGCVPTVTPVSTTVYNVSLASCTSGTVGLSIAASSVTDSANNSGPLMPYVGQTLTTLDLLAPVVASATTAAVNPTNADNLAYTVTFAESVTGFGAADITTIGTADNCNVSVSKVSDSVYMVTLSLCGDGNVGIKVNVGSVNDVAGNAGPSAAFSSALITVDRTAPDAPVVVNLPIPYTNAKAVNPTFVPDSTLVYTCEFDGVPVANTVTCNNGNMNFGQLSPGEHTLVVTAKDAAGNVSEPYIGTFEVGTFATPEAPDAPVITRTSLNRMLVEWNEPVASAELPVTGYRLEYTIDSNTWLPIATNGTETSVEIPATSGTVYKFRVKALSGVSPLDASPFSEESPYVAMYLPNIVNLNLGSSTLVPPAGTTLTITGQDFKVNGSTDNSGTVVTFGNIPAQVTNVAPDGTSVTVKVPVSPVEQVVDLTVTVGAGEFQNASVSRQAFRYVSTKSNQVLTHTPPTGVLTSSPDVALDASFNSLVPPVIGIAADSKTICSVISGKVHPLKAGTCNYTISAPAAGAYNAFAARAFKFTIGKGTNTTTLSLPDTFADGEVGITAEVTTLDGNSTAGLPLVFKAGPDSVCYVDSFNGLHLVDQGACTVTAASGNSDYVTSVDTFTFDIVRAAQTLNFVQPGTVIPGTTNKAEPATDNPTGFHLVADASSGLPLSYESRNPDVCDVDENGVVTWIGNPAIAGQKTCDIAINQEGDDNYEPLEEQIVTLTATPFIGPKPAAGSAVTEPAEAATLSAKGGTLRSGSESVGIKITANGVQLNVVSLSVLTGQLSSTYTIPYTYKDKKGKIVKTKQVCTVKFGITKVLPIATAAQKRYAYGPKQYKSATCALNKEAFAYFKAGNALVITQLLTKDFHWPTTYKTVIGADAKIAGKPFSQRIGKPLYLFKKTTIIRVEPPVK